MANISRSRKSGFTMRGGVSRRESLWLGIDPTQQALSTNPVAVILNSLNAAALALRPFTVVRTRGFILARSDQDGVDETYGCSWGLAIVSDQAIAIGVTAVPTPDTDIDSDLWFVYESILGRYQFSSGVGQGDVGTSRTYDSRAMRKVQEGQDIAVVVESIATSGFAGTSAAHVGRLLIKLH